MNYMVLPNRLCLIVKFYINRPELLPDTYVFPYIVDVYLKMDDSVLTFTFLPHSPAIYETPSLRHKCIYSLSIGKIGNRHYLTI